MSISSEAVPNEYIVVLKENLAEEALQQHCTWAQAAHAESAALRTESDGPELSGVGEQISFASFNAYVGSFDENLKKEIESREEVAFVEPNYIVSTCATVTQPNVPTWGLPRLSRTTKLPNRPPPWEYKYDSSAGAGTTAYVIDTGILTTHVEFEGRASWGFNATTDPNTDGNGHGTHVAGTIGSKTYGVAKKAKLIAVKVLSNSGSGSIDWVIKGVQFSVKHALDQGTIKKSVANLSLGGGKSDALNLAVNNAFKSGLVVVVAAGNSSKDASDFSPASAALAYTVGSIDQTDSMSSYSNFGKPVNAFAPGRDILSTWNVPGNTGTKTISGTSMASPHIAGLALYLIALNPAKYNTPTQVTVGITSLAQKNASLSPFVAGTTCLIGYNGL